MKEGHLHGEYLEYPITLKYREGIFEKQKTVADLDELLTWIIEYIDKLKGGNTLYEKILQAGLRDTVNLIDKRTRQLFEIYSHYKYAPHLINKQPFYDANRIFNMVLNNGF